MRILLFTSAYRPLIGGSEIALEQIALRLPEVKFDIVTPRYYRGFSAREAGGNIRIFRVGLGMHFDKFLFPFLGFFRALLLSLHERYDIFHAYQASYGAGAAYLMRCIKPRVPFLLTLQEGKPLDEQSFFVRNVRAFFVRRADHLTVISEYLKKFALGIRSGGVDIVPNGADTRRLAVPVLPELRREIFERFALTDDEWIFISVSRLVKKNGLENLIRAFASVRASHHAKLILVGDGPQRHELEDLIGQLKLHRQVLFAGKVPYKELPALLGVSHVFIRPSLSEGFGNAFIEAMAAGVPVIASRVGGIPDFLRDGETGLFCDPLSPDDIGEKMSRIVRDSGLRDKLIRQARKMVQEQYDWETVAKEMQKVYLAVKRPN